MKNRATAIRRRIGCENEERTPCAAAVLVIWNEVVLLYSARRVDGYDEAGVVLELVSQLVRRVLRGAGVDDGVEGSVLGPDLVAVAGLGLDCVVALLLQRGGGSLR